MSGFQGFVGNVYIEQFYNDRTLNIFTDGSSIRQKGGSFCAVAVVKDNIIEECCQTSNVNSAAAELQGLRKGLDIAWRHIYEFDFINIISDSAFAVNLIREGIYKWRYNAKLDTLVNASNQVSPQSHLIFEVFEIYKSLCTIKHIELLHTKAHVNANDVGYIKEATLNFKRINKVDGDVDFNLIRYLSNWNAYADNKAYTLTKRSTKINQFDPIRFYYGKKGVNEFWG